MGDNNQVEWEKGDREGPGGPLPTQKGKSLVIFSEVGKGTLDDPCVSCLPLKSKLCVYYIANNNSL